MRQNALKQFLIEIWQSLEYCDLENEVNITNILSDI